MTEDEMAGWHDHLNGHEFEQASRVDDGQRSLVCCSPWPSPSAGDLRELARVPLRGEGSCGGKPTFCIHKSNALSLDTYLLLVKKSNIARLNSNTGDSFPNNLLLPHKRDLIEHLL